MSLEFLPSGGSPFGRFFRSLRTKADGSFAGKPCGAFCCSWVLRSRFWIRRERGEEREGSFCFFGSLVWCSTVGRCGRGVRPSSVATRCCLSRSCPLGSPLAAFLPSWLMWGFRFRALLGCWSLSVVLSPFLGCVRFFPFVIYYNSMYPRYLQYIIRFIFRFFCTYPYYKE